MIILREGYGDHHVLCKREMGVSWEILTRKIKEMKNVF